MQDANDLIYDFFNSILGEEPNLEINQEGDELFVDLDLDPDHSGIIIGYRGEVLAAIQLVLSLMLQQDYDEWVPVRVDVNNYREQRADALRNLAHNTAEKVLQTLQPYSLPNLSSYERRLVHTALADYPEVESYSEGEGRNRILIVAPKN